MYINDLRNVITHCKHILYADDLHFPPHDIASAVERARADIAVMEWWVLSNRLSLNVGKTKAILLGCARYTNALSLANIDLELHGESIELTDSIRNLGLKISGTLSWSDHVQSIANRVNGVLWGLKRNKICLSVPLRTQFVSVLIFPIFDYCAAVLTDLTGQ
ncbi:PREDICTED: uncharacterized protein LOC108763954 [Trachymyrmex cornetzi]|uniref:uncharacterized protein LOC108763954 n=1 Tax=Trachymyrmex cornetzi TaxID=471704 RepID=UPI00084F6928|nr:PREDICTED: uncharacterized protein LOC108763954 [Trachymyrmex cornetzi]